MAASGFGIMAKEKLRMKIVSYYKQLPPEKQKLGGIGQGGGLYWQNVVGRKLQIALAEAAAETHSYILPTLVPRPHGKDSYDCRDYDVIDGDFDIAYCQLFDVPKKRPATWIYSIISDYLNLQVPLEDWLARTKPNVLFSFQYYRQDLIDQCRNHGCRCVFMPWFNETNYTQIHEKTITAMSSGCLLALTYPNRVAIYTYLEMLGRPDIILSGDRRGLNEYRLSNEEYQLSLAQTKYYISGGILDFMAPPKYFEVCNYGACLVSHDMPMMEQSGFIDGKTYIKINKVEDILDILDTDKWRDIGIAGQQMVQKRHTIKKRAEQILWTYNHG